MVIVLSPFDEELNNIIDLLCLFGADYKLLIPIFQVLHKMNNICSGTQGTEIINITYKTKNAFVAPSLKYICEAVGGQYLYKTINVMNTTSRPYYNHISFFAAA